MRLGRWRGGREDLDVLGSGALASTNSSDSLNGHKMGANAGIGCGKPLSTTSDSVGDKEVSCSSADPRNW